jgi:hypothetical protein
MGPRFDQELDQGMRRRAVHGLGGGGGKWRIWKSRSEEGEEGVMMIVGVAPYFSDISGICGDTVGSTRGGRSSAMRERRVAKGRG